MSGAMDAIWDESKIESYRRVLDALKNRIIVKHDQKGKSYLRMSLGALRDILSSEEGELDRAMRDFIFDPINPLPDRSPEQTKQRLMNNLRDEALDIAICGLLIADWVMEREG